MKKINGAKLMIAGVVLYAPLYLWQMIIGKVLPIVFYCFAIPSGLLFVVGFILVMMKKDDNKLYDEMDRTMKEKNMR
ncbi:MAG: hypothetical protein GX235_11820 [Clostridiales bacterium]|nr:hypothetical protein [Clostridiales bacterium]